MVNKPHHELIKHINCNRKSRYNTHNIKVNKYTIIRGNKTTDELINLTNCNGEYRYNTNNIKVHKHIKIWGQ